MAEKKKLTPEEFGELFDNAEMYANQYFEAKNGREISEAADKCAEYMPTILAHIAALEEERRWIPVTEKLPEPFVQVAVLSTHDGDTYVLTARCSNFTFDTEGVTHWMSLPNPPPVTSQFIREAETSSTPVEEK